MSEEVEEAEAEQKPGNRRIYDEKFAEQAQKLCQLGATDAELADFFKVARYTITRWKTTYPEFAEALRVGKDVADQRVVSSLYHRAVGYSFDSEKVFMFRGEVIRAPIVEHVPPDVTAQIFWLKNRDKENWRDRQTHEHTGKDGAAIEHKATVQAVMDMLPKVRDEC